MVARGFKGFPREALTFFRELAENNTRAWFQEHKPDFEEKVKRPMTELVIALGGAMQGFAPEMVTDPRRTVYRIYRDIRFSADKSPYKTHTAANFFPRGLGKHASASLYFHFGAEELLIAGGVYRPGSAELRAIRQHVAENWRELDRIIRDRRFRKLFGELEGEKLVRPPRGFPPDHPAIEHLRRKQYLVWVEEKPDLAAGPNLFPRIVTLFAAMMPLVRFLNEPLLKGRR